MSRTLALLLVFLASATTLVFGALWLSRLEALRIAMGATSVAPAAAFTMVDKSAGDIAVVASENDKEEADTVPIIRYATIADHLPDEGKFIAIDLLARQILTFQDGGPVATYPIVQMPATSTPREEASRAASDLSPRTSSATSSDFRLPMGMGEITDAQEKILGEGGTVIPWVVAFGSRCLAHGKPYTRDFTKSILGDDAPESTCLLLVDAHARALFSFAEPHTPFYIYDGTEHVVIDIPRLIVRGERIPRIDAKAFVIADLVTGDTYLERRADTRLPIASVTKLMTAAVSRDVLKKEQAIPVPGRSSRYVTDDLLYPLFLRSDNVVAEALASAYGRRAFVERMNTKARLLGMRDTSFEDASGISAGNRSTAADLARFARYLLEHDEELLETSAADRAAITSVAGVRWSMTNQNRFATDDSFLGGKLGFTESARQTGLSIFRVRIDGEARVIGIVTLGSDDWKGDTRALLSWFAAGATRRPGMLVASDREKAADAVQQLPAAPALLP